MEGNKVLESSERPACLQAGFFYSEYPMGQRANLIIVSNGSAEIYYTHHRATTLDKDLFWGPDYVKGFIRAQQPVLDRSLLDEIWAEGGAVMDLDKRHLLWFGVEFLTGRVPLRRLHAR